MGQGSESNSSHAAHGPRLLVSIATYNERTNIESLVPAVLGELPAAELLVVDDGSPDGTAEWVRQASHRDRRLHLIDRGRKLGLGSANLTAFAFALERGFDIAISMDGDWSHHPRYLAALVGRLDEPGNPADVVIGSRYVAGGSIQNWPWTRRLASRGVNAFARWLLRIPVADCSSGYRAYRVSLLARLPLDRIVSQGFSFYEEILVLAHKRSARMAEIPIEFTDRDHGASKANLREILPAAKTLFRLLFLRNDS